MTSINAINNCSKSTTADQSKFQRKRCKKRWNTARKCRPIVALPLPLGQLTTSQLLSGPDKFPVPFTVRRVTDSSDDEDWEYYYTKEEDMLPVLRVDDGESNVLTINDIALGNSEYTLAQIESSRCGNEAESCCELSEVVSSARLSPTSSPVAVTRRKSSSVYPEMEHNYMKPNSRIPATIATPPTGGGCGGSLNKTTVDGGRFFQGRLLIPHSSQGPEITPSLDGLDGRPTADMEVPCTTSQLNQQCSFDQISGTASLTDIMREHSRPTCGLLPPTLDNLLHQIAPVRRRGPRCKVQGSQSEQLERERCRAAQNHWRNGDKERIEVRKKLLKQLKLRASASSDNTRNNLSCPFQEKRAISSDNTRNELRTFIQGKGAIIPVHHPVHIRQPITPPIKFYGNLKPKLSILSRNNTMDIAASSKRLPDTIVSATGNSDNKIGRCFDEELRVPQPNQLPENSSLTDHDYCAQRRDHCVDFGRERSRPTCSQLPALIELPEYGPPTSDTSLCQLALSSKPIKREPVVVKKAPERAVPSGFAKSVSPEKSDQFSGNVKSEPEIIPLPTCSLSATNSEQLKRKTVLTGMHLPISSKLNWYYPNTATRQPYRSSFKDRLLCRQKMQGDIRNLPIELATLNNLCITAGIKTRSRDGQFALSTLMDYATKNNTIFLTADIH